MIAILKPGSLTGTKLTYKRGTIIGGRINHPHNCCVSQSIGYFLEPLIVLCLFAKEALNITLKGVTNDSNDPSVDTFKSVAFHILKRFGVDFQALSLKIESLEQEISLEPFVFTDHRSGPLAGNSPGYGILLVAETTSDCYISVDTAASHGRYKDTSEDDVKKYLMPPEDLSEGITNVLLGEIAQSGVVDSTHQIWFSWKMLVSNFKISDMTAKDSVAIIVHIWNKGFQNIKELGQGGDWSMFFKVVVFLYLLKLILSKLLTTLIDRHRTGLCIYGILCL